MSPSNTRRLSNFKVNEARLSMSTPRYRVNKDVLVCQVMNVGRESTNIGPNINLSKFRTFTRLVLLCRCRTAVDD